MLLAKCKFVNGERKEFTHVSWIEGEYGFLFSIDDQDNNIFINRSNVLYIELSEIDEDSPEGNYVCGRSGGRMTPRPRG